MKQDKSSQKKKEDKYWLHFLIFVGAVFTLIISVFIIIRELG